MKIPFNHNKGNDRRRDAPRPPEIVEPAVDHGLKTTINDMIDYIPIAIPLLIGAIQVHCETIAAEAEAIRKAEAESNANGKFAFFNVEAMIRDADAMLKRLHEGTE